MNVAKIRFFVKVMTNLYLLLDYYSIYYGRMKNDVEKEECKKQCKREKRKLLSLVRAS